MPPSERLHIPHAAAAAAQPSPARGAAPLPAPTLPVMQAPGASPLRLPLASGFGLPRPTFQGPIVSTVHRPAVAGLAGTAGGARPVAAVAAGSSASTQPHPALAPLLVRASPLSPQAQVCIMSGSPPPPPTIHKPSQLQAYSVRCVCTLCRACCRCNGQPTQPLLGSPAPTWLRWAPNTLE